MVSNEFNYSSELEHFTAEAGRITHLFPKPLLINNTYSLFFAEIGKDIFYFSKIPATTDTGNRCALFIEKYFGQFQPRHLYYEEAGHLINDSRTDSTEFLEGEFAYDRYWNEMVTDQEKIERHFETIPYFAILQDWFNLQFKNQVADKQQPTRSTDVLNGQRRRWIRSLHQRVAKYLDDTKITGKIPISFISAEHAHELMLFRDWLSSRLTTADGSSPSDGPFTYNPYTNKYALTERKVPFIGDLLHTRNIPDDVLDAYYHLTPQPTHRNQVPENYIGDLSHHNSPFYISLNGAYHLTHYINLLDAKIDDGYFQRLDIPKQQVDQALREYGQAFVSAYYSFEQYLSDKLGMFSSEKDKENFIYQIASGNVFIPGGYPESHGPGVHLLSGWPAAGAEGGRFYRAWYLILEHSQRFEPFFRPHPTSNAAPLMNPISAIIQCLYDTGIHAQQTTSLYSNKDENGIRDIFLHPLNTLGNGNFTASPETYNNHGKTDICIKDANGKTIFVAECKIWSGPKHFLEAINQLIDRYVHWNLKHAAILIFVKNPNFTRILTQIKETAASHTKFVAELPVKYDTSFPMTFHQSADEDRQFTLEIMAYPFHN